MVQSASLLGKPVAVQSASLPLQNGAAAVQFAGLAGQKVAINVSDSSGALQKSVQLTAAQGTNTWTWDGSNDAGGKLPDGAYKVSVAGVGGASGGLALPFNVVGTATGVQVQNNAVQLQLGGVTVPFSAVQSVGASVGVTPAAGG